MSTEAMKLALDALNAALSDDMPYLDRCKTAAEALRRALSAQPPADRSEIDRLNSERLDLALLIGRLIRRLRAASDGKGLKAGDDSIEQSALDYLRRKGLTSPLRDCGEAGHDEGRCGNASCSQPPAPSVPTGFLCRTKAQVRDADKAFPGEPHDYLWKYTHGTKELADLDDCDDHFEIIRLYAEAPTAIPAPPPVPSDELERKSDAIQKLWKERDELRAEVERLRAPVPSVPPDQTAEILRLRAAMNEALPFTVTLGMNILQDALDAAPPPVRERLTMDQVYDAVKEADLDWQLGWAGDDMEVNRYLTLVRIVERALIGGEG